MKESRYKGFKNYTTSAQHYPRGPNLIPTLKHRRPAFSQRKISGRLIRHRPAAWEKAGDKRPRMLANLDT